MFMLPRPGTPGSGCPGSWGEVVPLPAAGDVLVPGAVGGAAPPLPVAGEVLVPGAVGGAVPPVPAADGV
jgi:hypothetical protein